MRRRKKKIARVFSVFHVSIHVGTSVLDDTSTKRDTMECYISKNGGFEYILK
jgi:hypothetical protein